MEDTLVIDPSAEHRATVIFLHGRGGSPEEIAEAINPIIDAFKDAGILWIFPRATFPADATTGVATRWFDNHDFRNFQEKEEVQIPGLTKSVEKVLGILEKERKSLGDGKIFLAGFSQGGGVASHTLLHLDKSWSSTLAGFMGFACRMPFAAQPKEEMRKVLALPDGVGIPGGRPEEEYLQDVNVMLATTEDDHLMPTAESQLMHNRMMDGLKWNAQWWEFKTGGHAITGGQLERARIFMAANLGIKDSKSLSSR